MADTQKPWEMNWEAPKANPAPQTAEAPPAAETPKAAEKMPWEMDWKQPQAQPEAQAEQPYKENVLLRTARNVAEVPTTLISTLTTAPISGLYHSIVHPSGKGFEADFVEGSEKGTYQPRNPTNRKILEKIVDFLDESKLAGAMGIPELELLTATKGMPMMTAPITTPIKEAASKVAAPVTKAIKESPEAHFITNYINEAEDAQNALKVQNFNRDRSVKQAVETGYKVTPSAAGSGKIYRIAEGIGGQAKTAETARIHNQTVTNDLAKKFIGLDAERELTTDAINALKDIHNEAYVDVAALPEITREIKTPIKNDLMNRFETTIETVIPSGAKLLDDLKDTRFQARGSWRKAFAEGDPEAFKRAKMLDLHADRLENQIDELAKAHNQPELIENLKEARTNLAKIHTVEKAFNDETGNVNAAMFRTALNKKKLLTGEALKIAKFSKAFPDLARVPKYAGITPISPIDVAATAIGHGTGSKIADVMLTRPLFRKALMTERAQKGMAQNYGSTPGMMSRESGYAVDAFKEAMKNAPTLKLPTNPNLYGVPANQLSDNMKKGGKVANLIDIYNAKKR